MIYTEVYVSVDNINFTKLDLEKSESIPMKYVQKDTQDLSKIFSPYSQSFNFKATPNNQKALEFWGNTEVLKSTNGKLFYCKVYANDLLCFVGFLKVSDLTYKNYKPEMYSGNFTTLMADLKSRMGDDLINDLSDVPVTVNWTPNSIYPRIATTGTVSGVKYYVPLISTNRVWAFDPTGDEGFLDNVAYNVSNSASGNDIIKSDELRPTVSFKSIMDLIKSKYDLDIVEPFINQNEYKDLYAWCNGDNFYSLEKKKFRIITNLGARYVYNDNADFTPKKYTATSSTVDSSIKVVRSTTASVWNDFFTLRVNFNGVSFTGGGNTKGLQMSLVRKSDGIEFANASYTANDDNSFQCDIPVYDSYFISDEIEFFIYIKFEQPTIWQNSEFRINYKAITIAGIVIAKATYAYRSDINNNSVLMNATDVDLIKSLPEMKVIDFLTSYFKTFNISVFETAPDSDKLYWLNPKDINTINNVYSKAEADYTPYVQSLSKKSRPNDYNYYNFKHANSEYNSNVNYKIGSGGMEYGQLTYPEVKPTNPNEYKVETNFSIIPPIVLNGTNNFVTYYGFTAEAPEILDSGAKRYTPNTKELTLFYSHGINSLGTDALGFQVTGAGYVFQNGILTNYIKSMPFCKSSNQSLSFSILVFNNIQYPINLFSQYYLEQTLRYLNDNALKQEFDLILPISELYLNEESTIQGFGNVPKGFRLQNDIIISETRFSIIDATIDRVSGKAKLTLLNYT